MSQTENLGKLQRFDSEKLKDIVKNYKQYGYDLELRELVIGILNERGIDLEELRLTGHLVNENYERAQQLFKAFQISSNFAFTSYLLFLLSLVVPAFFKESPDTLVYIDYLNVIFLLMFVAMMIRSFVYQNQFLKLAGKSEEHGGAVVYFLLGMPLYFFMYFYFVSRMKVIMSSIR